MTVALIVAMSRNHVIGHEGDMPWRLSADLKRFKKITLGRPVIMGRKTWDSIGRPLPGRLNIVITRNQDYIAEGAQVVSTLGQAIDIANSFKGLDADNNEIFIIGGGEIYRQSIALADKLYVTHVEAELTGDTVFPKIDAELWVQSYEEFIPSSENDMYPTRFTIYQRR